MNDESLGTVADAIDGLPSHRRTLVAVDGPDGAGKTTFADLLAHAVERPVIRASCDDFHHPRAHRHRRGRRSPEGCYRDSFDYDTLTSLLLGPFSAGLPFRRRAFDHVTDRPVEAVAEDAPGDAVLVLDGLFLHREELRRWWDVSVLLDVPPEVAAARFRRRDGVPIRDRYVRGQELYVAEAEPRRHASLVVEW